MKPRSIYVLIDPRDNQARYVGCSGRVRARKNEHKSQARKSRTAKAAWLRELAGLGLEPVVQVLESPVADWEEAEQRWIASYRQSGAPLLNQTDGGAGSPGYVMPEEERRRVGERTKAIHTGRRRSEESKARMAERQKEAWKNPDRKPAPPRSVETRARMSEAQRGKKASEETRRRISEAHSNPSEETRQKLREAVLRRPEEQRKAFGQINKGRRFTDEHKAKIAEAARRRWAKTRGEVVS
jgi:hypothetical protein